MPLRPWAPNHSWLRRTGRAARGSLIVTSNPVHDTLLAGAYGAVGTGEPKLQARRVGRDKACLEALHRADLVLWLG
jgi:hypothetical protein